MLLLSHNYIWHDALNSFLKHHRALKEARMLYSLVCSSRDQAQHGLGVLTATGAPAQQEQPTGVGWSFSCPLKPRDAVWRPCWDVPFLLCFSLALGAEEAICCWLILADPCSTSSSGSGGLEWAARLWSWVLPSFALPPSWWCRKLQRPSLHLFSWPGDLSKHIVTTGSGRHQPPGSRRKNKVPLVTQGV